MDDFDASYHLYRDKALDVIRATDNFFLFFIITFLSVFLPLSITLANDYKEFETILIYFIISVPIVFIPVLLFMISKYREYKYKYTISLIKSIKENNFSSSGNNSKPPSYREVCERITYVTNFNYDDVMTSLFEIYPPK